MYEYVTKTHKKENVFKNAIWNNNGSQSKTSDRRQRQKKLYAHKTTTRDIIKIYVQRATALIEIARAYMWTTNHPNCCCYYEKHVNGGFEQQVSFSPRTKQPIVSFAHNNACIRFVCDFMSIQGIIYKFEPWISRQSRTWSKPFVFFLSVEPKSACYLKAPANFPWTQFIILQQK